MLDLLTPNAILPALKVTSKKQALQELARKAAELTGQHERAVFDVLIERERLGTTGVGHGIAIPHGKLTTIDRVYGAFARLEKPIDYEAIDDQPVDLLFMLLAPEQSGADHLKALARVSRLLRDTVICAKLRGSDNADAIYSLLTQNDASNAH
jgi:PTS system nitrogen regulatory IIA component